MTKHFEPHEIWNAEAKANDYTMSQVDTTLRHYGFIPVKKRDSKHIQYKHREYKDLFSLMLSEGVFGCRKGYFSETLTFPFESTLPPAYVKFAAAACLKVKELNARRREGEDLLELPAWLTETLNSITKDDGTPKFDQELEGEVLRLSREPNGEARRSYRIVCKPNGRGNVLEVMNLNFPEYAFSFNLVEGDRNPRDNFLRLFEEQDQRVKAHIAERERDYYVKLGRLVAKRGFSITRDDPDMVSIPLLHLKHDGLDMQFETIRVPEHETIANESIEMVEEALEDSEKRYFEELEFIDKLERQGWKIHLSNEQHHYSDADLEAIGRGSMVIDNHSTAVFEAPGGNERFELTAYGSLPVYGAELAGLQERYEKHRVPDLRVQPACCYSPAAPERRRA